MTEQAQQAEEAVSFEGIEFVGFEDEAPQPEKEVKKLPEESESEDESTENKDEQQEPAPKQISESETEARSRGWTSKSEWIAAGKDPDDWVSAKHFNEKGRLISQSRKLEQLEKTFDTRINNVKVLYEAQANQLKAENARLQTAKRDAIRYGEVDEVERIDKELMSNAVNLINVERAAGANTPQPMQPSQDEVAKEAEWEKKNPWIFTNDPTSPDFGKAMYVKQLYGSLVNYPEYTADQRIAYVEQEIAAKFPQAPKANPNREKAALTDTKTSNHAPSGKLTWADLSPSELSDYNKFGSTFYKDKSEYLQTVSDIRRGKK